MGFEIEKGMIAVATSYSNGLYHYSKLDPYIEQSSYQITPDSVQEMDSYRNANGELKRPNIMPYTVTKAEFNIRHGNEKILKKVTDILHKGVRVKDGIVSEKKLKIRYFDPLTMDYKHAWAYYPDITFAVYGTYKGDGKEIYTPTRVAFITYGEKMDL